MSNTLSFLAATLACIVLWSTAAVAADGGVEPQTEQGILLDTIRANRKALVAVNLQLSAEEASRFWPLYDRYQTEIKVIGDRLAVIVDDYIASFRDLSNEKALQLMQDYLAAEAERAQVRRTYLASFAEILPGRTVARFYQIENKMDAILRYDLAATIPVVDEKPDAPAK